MKRKIIASFIATALMLSQASVFAMHEPMHGETEETERYMQLYADTENEFADVENKFEDIENYSEDVESDFENNAELFAETSGDYNYTINSDSDTVTITKYTGSDTEIIIPSEINGKKVTSIGEDAFYYCSSLKSIEIPNSVTSIGDWAFWGCSSLASITIPDSVTSIGRSAFYGTALYNNGGNWKDGVLYIGKHLITAKVSGEYEIKDGTLTIANYAFPGCSSLESVEIPDSVTNIGISAFFGCSSVKSFTVSENNQYYTSVDGVLFNKEMTEIMYYPAKSDVTEYIVPDRVTNIGDYAFHDCSSLKSVTIPDSVTNIGDYAFYDCSSLKSVTIPNSVKSIGSGAFYDCSSLKSVTIPNSVTSIGYNAFKYCSSLASIEIPESVTRIEGAAFYGCSSLESITIPDGVTRIEGAAFYGCSSLESITIPDGVTSIGGAAFSGTALYNNEENWEDDVLYIGKYLIDAKEDISGEYTIKNGTVIIADGAFSECHGLEDITFPDSVTSIGSGEFWWCSSLASVTIPDGVTSIGNDAFTGCNNLTIYGYENSYAQTYAKNNNIPFSVIINFNDVTLDKLEVSYENGKVEVKVSINTEKNSGFTVYAAVYDDNGKMIGIKKVNVSDTSVTIDVTGKPKKVKVFAFRTSDGASPLCENWEITDI